MLSKEISDTNNGLEPVQKQAVYSKKSQRNWMAHLMLLMACSVNDNSVVKKHTADNLDGEGSATDVPVEECTTDVPMEDSTTNVPVEDSTIDIPKKDLATSTKEEQTTTDGKAKASGKGGSKWKDHH